MLSDLPWNPRHVRGFPSNDIPILDEESNELAMLNLVQALSYVGSLALVPFLELDLL